MAYRLPLVQKTIEGAVNIFDSTMIRWITGGVTIDAETVTAVGGKKILPIGTPLGKIPATGKYGPYDAGATDGREIADCVLGEWVDVTEGDVVATAFDWARLIQERLPVVYDQALLAMLPGITIVGKAPPNSAITTIASTDQGYVIVNTVGSEGVTTPKAATVADLLAVLTSTDRSTQTYAVVDSTKAAKTDEEALVSGDLLVVTAQDGKTSTEYAITVTT